MKKQNSITKIIAVTQFGLSLIMPVLLCVFAAAWIQKRFDTGYWVIITGILVGILSMVNMFVRYYRQFMKGEKERDQYPPGSNRHW